jgi:FkbM family methyltransferase
MLAIDKAGFKVTMPVKYPTGHIFKVLISSFWKRLERLEWETDNIHRLTKLIEKNDIIFDVGAWNGVYTLLFSRLVGDKGRVYAFEPDHVALKALERNLKLNEIKNVVVVPIALSNKNGFATLMAKEFGGSGSTIIRRADKPKSTYVMTTTMDYFCIIENIIPNGVKIDVEGAEDLVLEGASRIREKDTWFFVEYHGRQKKEWILLSK